MSILRLTAKIGADATSFHSTMKGVESAGLRAGRVVGQQLRSGLLMFFGFSGIRRWVAATAELVDNWDEMQKKAKAFGIEMDASVIVTAQKARREFEAIKMLMLTKSVPYLTAAVELMKGLITLTMVQANITKQYMIGSYAGGQLGGPWGMLLGGRQGMRVGMRSGAKQAKDFLSWLDEVQPYSKDETSKSNLKIPGMAGITESSPKMLQESLSKIGGFTGRAGEELKSIQQRQLSQLKSIEQNTAILKKGVA